MVYFSIMKLILIIIFFLFMIISFKKKSFFEKMISFECGFDLFSSSRIPFSLQFFLITIIFLIFDIELILLIPLVKIFYYSDLFIWSLLSMLIIFILLIGIFFEWKFGVLEWVN